MTTTTIQNKRRPARILLVEDNHGDVILTRRALQDAKIDAQLSVATTGEDALTMLRKEGAWATLELPDLVLLDLNLPQINGHEVLRVIKESPELKHIPVIMLSSSSAEQDVAKSYRLYANSYIVKPANLESFGEVIRKLEQFWFTLVVMPDTEDMHKAS